MNVCIETNEWCIMCKDNNRLMQTVTNNWNKPQTAKELHFASIFMFQWHFLLLCHVEISSDIVKVNWCDVTLVKIIVTRSLVDIIGQWSFHTKFFFIFQVRSSEFLPCGSDWIFAFDSKTTLENIFGAIFVKW